MHPSSIIHMRKAIERHIAPLPKGLVLEVGSASLEAPYRALFRDIGWDYVGVDIGPGPNVDLILEDAFSWSMEDQSVDAVISGQMLEHNEMFWLTFLEMARVLRPGGIMIHIAPSRGHEHPGPTDCWRFYRDGMTALARWSGLDCIETRTDWAEGDMAKMKKKGWSTFPTSPWGDTVGVFRKAAGARPETALAYMKTLAAKWE